MVQHLISLQSYHLEMEEVSMIPSHANCTVMNFNEDLNRSIQERAQHVELKQLEIA